ncbi:collagen alpha-1(XI) chain-like, partial [Tachysurus ichikawai]
MERVNDCGYSSFLFVPQYKDYYDYTEGEIGATEVPLEETETKTDTKPSTGDMEYYTETELEYGTMDGSEPQTTTSSPVKSG